jgi:hypothetical protein
MPDRDDWTSARREAHDSYLRASAESGQKAASTAKALLDDLAKMNAHAEAVLEAVLGRKPEAGEQTMHGLIASLCAHGQEILNAGPQSLTPAQIRAHGQHMAAIGGLLEKSAQHAAELGRHFSDIREQHLAIAKLSEEAADRGGKILAARKESEVQTASN